MENNNKSVYPQIGSVSNNDNQLTEVFSDENNSGLTKREYFAGLAMQSLISGIYKPENINADPSAENTAKTAIMYADELLKQLEITKI